MNSETRLLNRAIAERDLSYLLKRGVADHWFSDPDDRRLWQFVRSHYSKYAECPSLEVIQSNFPSFKPLAVEDSIEYLVDDVVARGRKVAISRMLHDAIEKIDRAADHEAALQALQSGMVGLDKEGLNFSDDLDLTDNPIQRWNEYQERKNLPNGMRGFATGFETVDKVTSGIQNGQLVVIIAPPKTGKSTFCLQVAHNMHQRGVVPLFQSFEMSNLEQTTRYDAMRARISHDRLQNGKLNPDEEARYQAKLKTLGDMEHKFWLSGAVNGSTVSDVSAKVQALQPDVLFIDGVYLMIDEQTGRSNEAIPLTNITRSLKRLAQRFNIPVIISTQTLNHKLKNGRVTADSIGYSSSFLQDADLIFSLEREDPNVDDTRLLKLQESRNTGRMEVSLLWDWNNGQFRELDEEDL